MLQEIRWNLTNRIPCHLPHRLARSATSSQSPSWSRMWSTLSMMPQARGRNISSLSELYYLSKRHSWRLDCYAKHLTSAQVSPFFSCACVTRAVYSWRIGTLFVEYTSLKQRPMNTPCYLTMQNKLTRGSLLRGDCNQYKYSAYSRSVQRLYR